VNYTIEKLFKLKLFNILKTAGIQATYNDSDELSLKIFIYMILALSFVPLNVVPHIFSFLGNYAPEDIILPIFDYFLKNLFSWSNGSRKKTRDSFPLFNCNLDSLPSGSDWFT